MRKTKKVRWILLLLSTVFTLASIPATSIKSSLALDEYTISDNDIEDNLRKDYKSLFQSIAYEPEAFGLISADLEGLSFMQAVRFITPNTTESELKNNKNNHVVHIPLMNKRKEIVLIYSVLKTDEGLSATLGIDFAPMLNEALELGFSDVVLMQDTGGLYARDVRSHAGLKMEGSKVVRTAKQEAHSTFLLNIELSDLVKLPYVALSLDSIDSRLSRLAAQSLTDGMSIIEKRNNAMNSKEMVPMYYPDILYLSNYPIVDQNVNGVQRGLCWAATVASMCRFELPGKWSNLTAKQVADQMNIGYDAGGQSKDIINALTSYLGSPYSPQDRPVLSEYDIKVVINNNDPAYMRCTLKTGFWPWNKDRHGVALAGR